MLERNINLCRAITQKKTSCKNNAIKGKNYCTIHLKKNLSTGKYLYEHKDEIISFLAGALADPVAGDFYEFLKEQIGMKHFVPPVPVSDDLPSIGKNIRFGMHRSEVHRLLGKPFFRWDIKVDYFSNDPFEPVFTDEHRIHDPNDFPIGISGVPYETALDEYSLNEYDLIIRYGTILSRKYEPLEKKVISIEYRKYPEIPSEVEGLTVIYK
jgi:hypothetical protein